MSSSDPVKNSNAGEAVHPGHYVLTGSPGLDLDGLARLCSDRLGRPVSSAHIDDVVERPRSLKTRAESVLVWVDPDCFDRSAAEVLNRAAVIGPLLTAADIVVHPDSLEQTSVVQSVLRAVDGHDPSLGDKSQRVMVALPDGREYPIVVGRDLLESVAEFIPEKAERVAIITQPGIGQIYGSQIKCGREQRLFETPEGEQAKQVSVLADLASQLVDWGLTRRDCIVTLGGGVVSDLGGYLAASYHRGVPVVHVPTTLIGQVDAAIGGKCGVNLPEGKNLLGAFWQPEAVLCDVNTLESLPAEEFRAGMGELAKYHFLGADLAGLNLVELVAAAAEVKARVVSKDEREGGLRALLNYGHTLAHALETASDYKRFRHGDAVAIGLLYAAKVAQRLGRINQDRVLEHRRVIERYGHIGVIPAELDARYLIELFGRDKKALDGVTLVLDGPNGIEPVRVDQTELLVEVAEALQEEQC